MASWSSAHSAACATVLFTLSCILQPVSSSCNETEADCFASFSNRASGASANASHTCGVPVGELYDFGGLTFASTSRIRNLICNASDPHPPSFFNDGDITTWWQAPYATPDVTVQLDWTRPILFNSTVVTFRSLPAREMTLEYSTNRGVTWSIYQYFSEDCMRYFGLPVTEPAAAPNSSDAVCVTLNNLVIQEDRVQVS